MDANARLGACARANPAWLWASSALGACAGILVLPQAFLLARVIDGVFLRGADVAGVAAPLAGIVGLLALRGVLGAKSQWCAHRLAEAVKAQLHQRLHTQVLTLGPAFTRGERTGELVASATQGLEQLDAYLRGYLPQRTIAALVPLAVLAAALPLDWITGVTLLVTAPLVPLFMVLVGTLAATQGARQFAALRAIGAQLLDALQGLTTLKLFGRSEAQAETLAELGDRFRKASMATLQYAFLSSLVMELIATIGTALVAVGLGLRLLHGRIGFEESLFLLLLAPELYAPLRTLGTQFHAATNARAAASRIFGVLDRRPLARSGPRRVQDPSAPRLSFEDVHVEYPDGRRGLAGVSFDLAAGERIALAGPTGAGKSTTVDLLLRFIDPSQGTIRWNGIAVTELASDDVRAHIAWVPQRPYLLPASVAENLRLGRADASDDALWTALAEVGLAETVRSLPQGLETVLGERGATLSGGQAQRLAIARALLKDAPLVIFDEPTAQLDVDTERGIEEAIERLTRGRTALIVTHRLALAQRVDRVLVLEEGRLVRSGPPDAGGGVLADVAGPAGGGRALALARPGVPAIDAPHASTAGQGPRTHRSAVRLLVQAIRPLWRPVALAVAAAVLSSAGSIALMATSAYLLAHAALRPSIAELQVAIVGVRFFGLSRALLRYAERLTAHDATFRIVSRLRVWFYQALEPLAPAALQRRTSGDLLSRALTDVGTLEGLYARGLGPPLTAALTTFGVAAFVATYDVSLGVVVLAVLGGSALLLPVTTVLLSRGLEPGLAKARAAVEASWVISVQGAADLIAFGAQGRQTLHVSTAHASLARLQRREAAVLAIETSLGTVLAGAAPLALVVAFAPLVRDGALAGVDVPTLALTTLAAFEPILAVPQAIRSLRAALASSRRLLEVVDVPPPVREPSTPARLPSSHDITFQAVDFRYPVMDAPAVLRGLDLEVRAGQVFGIVGESGAGKSTLLDLLVRFREPDAGSISVGGVDVRNLCSRDLRARIAYVGQRTYLFHGSLRDNLRVAKPDATDAELDAVLQAAQLGAWFRSLPRGHDTQVGEDGVRLSGGERQRLAIARALLKDAPIVLLDEPTANLDAATEGEVIEALRPLIAGRTTLLATHRPAPLALADAVYVLEGGRLQEVRRPRATRGNEGGASAWRERPERPWVAGPFAPREG